MKFESDLEDAPDAILGAGEGDAAFAAWTLEELDDDLGGLRSAVLGGDDVGA